MDTSQITDNGSFGIEGGANSSVTNSTINQNGRDITNGGGIIFDDGGAVSNGTIDGNIGSGVIITSGDLSLSSSTFYRNSGNGVAVQAGATASLQATFLQGNSQGNCHSTPSDQGYNLSSDTSCNFGGRGSDNGVTTIRPAAGLRDGGLTIGPAGAQQQLETLALLSGSSAIDAIPLADDGSCQVGTTSDERGVARPQGAGCDVGAFEVVAASFTVPNCPTQGQLQAYLDGAPRDHSSYTVTLTGKSCSISLDSALTVPADANVTLQASGLTVIGTSKIDAFTALDTPTDATAFNLDDATIKNSASGIDDPNFNATISVTNSTFSDNGAGISGGAYNLSVSVTDSLFTGNGDGIYSGGNVDLENSAILDSRRYGITAANVSVQASTISGSGNDGISSTGGSGTLTVTVANSTVSDNQGRGIAVVGSGRVILVNSTVAATAASASQRAT